MPFYTFIMEYAGGTYISQVKAASPRKAVVKGAQKLNVSEIYKFGQVSKDKLIEEMKTKEISLLNSLKNVWFVSALIRGELALINLVQTDENN